MPDANVQQNYGEYFPGIGLAWYSLIIDADKNKNIPTNNAAIATIPSDYRPDAVVQTMALVVPGASGGWVDVRAEKCYLDKNGKIALNYYITGGVAIKFFYARFIYYT